MASNSVNPVDKISPDELEKTPQSFYVYIAKASGVTIWLDPPQHAYEFRENIVGTIDK